MDNIEFNKGGIVSKNNTISNVKIGNSGELIMPKEYFECKKLKRIIKLTRLSLSSNH